MRKLLFTLLTFAALILAACGGGGGQAGAPAAEKAPAAEQGAQEAAQEAAPAAKSNEEITIVVSMKGPGGGNPFWASVEKGASEKGAELGVNVVVVAPPAESDVASQINQLEDQIVKGVDAIAVAPTDPSAFNPVLEQAREQGIPVLFIDTMGELEGATFIGTDNMEGARLAAEYICNNVESGSDVAILQGIITQSTGQMRAEGSKAGLEACGLNVVAEQPANWDRAEGQSVMENILTGNPNLKAVFASNDNMALGAVEALKAAEMLDQVIVVGFDANPDAAESILAGEMSATVAQNPYNMGALGVENALKLIHGETIPEVIDTGTVLVTAENADQYLTLAPSEEQAAQAALDLSQVNIVVGMKGPGGGNPFWAAVERGATEKGQELGVNVTVLAPPAESDVASQINQIEDQIAKDVDAIVIAVTDPAALSPVLEQATAEGTPVLFIDTMGQAEGALTYIGTDNKEGARLAAEYICNNVPPGGKVAILQGIITQSTGQQRAEGSKAGLEACGLNVVAEQPANWDRAEGQTVMENILTGNPDLNAVFASNDNMALGAVEALKAADMLDQVIVVGFDANPDAAESILAGEMSATVAQNPYNMGALGVENAVKALMGEEIPPIIDTGTVLVTAENAEEFR